MKVVVLLWFHLQGWMNPFRAMFPRQNKPAPVWSPELGKQEQEEEQEPEPSLTQLEIPCS